VIYFRHPFPQACLVILLLVAGRPRESRAEELQPVQIWVEEKVSYSPRKDLTFIVKTEQRVSTEDRFLRHLETVPEVIWNASDIHSAFVGYKRIDLWNSKGESSSSDMAVFGHNATFPLAEDWRLASRQMFEAGVSDDESTGQFRYRLTLSHQNKQFLWGVKTALSNEWYYDFDTDRISQNRLKLAFSHSIGEHVEWEIYAMRRDDWLPGDSHLLTPVVGLSIDVLF
jgi:hypothetical protein